MVGLHGSRLEQQLAKGKASSVLTHPPEGDRSPDPVVHSHPCPGHQHPSLMGVLTCPTLSHTYHVDSSEGLAQFLPDVIGCDSHVFTKTRRM